MIQGAGTLTLDCAGANIRTANGQRITLPIAETAKSMASYPGNSEVLLAHPALLESPYLVFFIRVRSQNQYRDANSAWVALELTDQPQT